VPEVPTLASLAVIVGILALATTTSVLANRRDRYRGEQDAAVGPRTESVAVQEREPAGG
jgi:hypothetical protein